MQQIIVNCSLTIKWNGQVGRCILSIPCQIMDLKSPQQKAIQWPHQPNTASLKSNWKAKRPSRQQQPAPAITLQRVPPWQPEEQNFRRGSRRPPPAGTKGLSLPWGISGPKKRLKIKFNYDKNSEGETTLHLEAGMREEKPIHIGEFIDKVPDSSQLSIQ